MTRLVLCSAAAGALGWGIRGQYGHETGAMVAGLLVSLVVVGLLRPDAPAAWAMRAVAFGTVGAGFGGAMTYGQTIGLTQDVTLVGNAAALRWGLIGLAVKGGVWIGFLGASLGIGLSGVRHRPRDVALLMLALVALAPFGIWLLNEPHVPEQRLLPRLYFSASWHWRPDAVDLAPRREVWGGLLLALCGLAAYAAIRKDVVTLRLLGWGVVGGAVGFPLGQSLQAWHAWQLAAFTGGAWASLEPYVNWWNLMETTFGAVMGGMLAVGAWRMRAAIAEGGSETSGPVPATVQWAGVLAHAALIATAEFTDLPVLGRYTDVALVIGVLPLTLAAAGGWAPVALALPVTLLPVAGKTVRRLVYETPAIGTLPGWLLYGAAPMALSCLAVWWVATRCASAPAWSVVSRLLLQVTWTYVALNFAVFQYPWPWAPWTNRTLHALLFFTCAVLLTRLAVRPAGVRGGAAPGPAIGGAAGL